MWFRRFEPTDGPPVDLGLSGSTFFERRDRWRPTTFEHSVRAFVALANRARALALAGYVELAPAHASDAPVLVDYDTIAAYAGMVDSTRSLPRQEMVVAMALTAELARRDARVADQLATLTLLRWPVTFDVGALLAELDGPEEALTRVLARELARPKSGYPKELVRQAMIHGSAESCTLALRALSRTKDPDAWFDVLIEGDPFFDRSHVPALTALAAKAPSKDIAKMAREIAKDLAPARRPTKKRR